MEKERLIGVLVGLIFMVFLILIVLIVFNFNEGLIGKSYSKTSSTSGQTTINNYYENTYELPEKPSSENVVYKNNYKMYVVYKEDCGSWRDRCGNFKRNFRDEFSSYGKQKKYYDGLNYVDEYHVFVRNRGNNGKYFQVVFYFKWEKDLIHSQSMLKWIDGGETREFVYRDVHFERFGFKEWSYDIFNQEDGFENEIFG